MKGLTQKQETFILEYFKGGNATEAAIKAGYSPKTAQEIGSENLLKPIIAARLEELRKKAESSKIMAVVERKERLSEIARARLTDFVAAGENGARITVNLESAHSAALSEVTTEEVKDGRGEDAPMVQVTKLKLRDPIAAIAELNKMDGSYQPEKKEIRITNSWAELVESATDKRADEVDP